MAFPVALSTAFACGAFGDRLNCRRRFSNFDLFPTVPLRGNRYAVCSRIVVYFLMPVHSQPGGAGIEEKIIVARNDHIGDVVYFL
jgi:hypothetical protein